jgi:uncharacterized protein with HEPN domain
MLTKKYDLVYLKHILDAIKRIDEYTHGMKRRNFMDDHLVQDGTIRQLEVIGEAAKRLSKEFTDAYPNVPWKDMAGMRDRLIHGYFGVDLDAVWETLERDIPRLRGDIGGIVKKIERAPKR